MTEKTSDSAKQVKNLSEQQLVDSILEHMPSNDEVAVELPSKNKFYNLKEASKPISLRPMTFEDEKAMVSTKNMGKDILNMVLSRCISNINVNDLLQMDKLHLIMKLRELSYGDEYNAVISCPSCKKDSEVTFTLSNMPVNFLEDDATDPMVFDLPVLKKQVKARFPRVSDEHYFTTAEFAIQNLWRFVEEIDGCRSKTVISKVVPQLPLKDAHRLLDHLSGTKYGVDTQVKFFCAYCSHTENMELPIGTDFFTAT